MLRDNLVGLIEPMLGSAGANPLALSIARKKPSDDRPPCLENPRPEGAESTLTENAPSPFQAEPRHYSCSSSYNNCRYKETFDFQRPYGLVRWIYYVLQNGQYVQQNQSVFNNQVSGGSPIPDHPCW
jgi:hypothetical protein